MNDMQKGLVTLLKSAITEKSLPLPDGFCLEAAYPQIKRHHMVAMCYDGAVRCGIDRKDPTMQRMFQDYCRALLVSEGQMADVRRVFAAFEANGIDYMPLKGCKMKALYPKPELRIMGDADVLIRLEQYEKIVPIMESLGFSSQANTDHELVWTTANLYLELHKRLIPSYNKDFHRYFADCWRFAVKGSGTQYTMTAEDEMVFLFTHFAKHYRDGGIGCRYVADLWVYLRAHPELDESRVKALLEKLQLREFYENIRRLMAVWFEDAQSDEKMDFITDFIFASGSWGNMESRTISVGVRDSGQGGKTIKGKWKYIWRLLFPTAGMLQDKYTVLQKAPWMLPLVWVYRPFYKVLCEAHTLKKHRTNLRVLTPENLQTRREALNYVGLDYHF